MNYLTVQEEFFNNNRLFIPNEQFEEDQYSYDESSRTYTIILDGVVYDGINELQVFISTRKSHNNGIRPIDTVQYKMHHVNDYYKATKEILGIDMKLNHVAQHSGDPRKRRKYLKDNGRLASDV